MTLSCRALCPALALGLIGASPSPSTASADVERMVMVARIQREIHAASPDADTPNLRRVLAAVARVPREAFVDRGQRDRAYQATSLPIGHGQTISDAYIVAVMIAALDLPAHANVLDVGTGSGYQAAVLALLVDHVSSIEIIPGLARSAGHRLGRLGYANVAVWAGDGYAGWPAHAPFDGIVVAAGAADVPRPLLDQLGLGGKLIMPIGPNWATEQILVVTRKGDGTMARCSLGWSVFVPFTGAGARPSMSMGLARDIPLCYARPVARADVITLPPGKRTSKFGPSRRRAP